MKISGRTDIGAPGDFVFGYLSDFDNWERAALRRGADVTRTDKLKNPANWKGQALGVTGLGSATDFLTKALAVKAGLKATDVTLVSLASKRTRLLAQVEAKPRTLAARLFIQSLKLAKSRVQKRYDTRLDQLARDIEIRAGGTGQA